ncbi:MAG: sugar transferase [Bacteroidales bacterium]|nr:sugar transferase [Bacteroidales bacterium]MBN2821295.1 sugar transferase [Bacteroidales bacterium]
MPKSSKEQQALLKSIFNSLDIVITIITLMLASVLTNYFQLDEVVYDSEFALIISFVTITWFILLKATHLSKIPRTSGIPVILADFIKLSVIGGFIILLLDWIITIDSFPSIALIVFVILNFVSLFIFRLITFKFFKKFRANGYNTRNLIVIANEKTDFLIEKILFHKEWGYKILHLITDSKLLREKYRNFVKIHPKSVNIKSLVRFDIIDELICCDCELPDARFYSLVDFCNEIGVTIRISNDKKVVGPYRSHVRFLDKLPFYTIENNPNNRYTHVLKTIYEVSLASIFLLVLSPVISIIALMVGIDSRGPVIFKQQRVGLHGRKFYIYKFRTISSEIAGVGQIMVNKENGPVFTISGPPHISSFGKLLRKTNIDNFPQLFNIIKGEMSFIGPRPTIPSEVDKYSEWQMKKLSVKPGLINSIIEKQNLEMSNSPENTIKKDIQYIENWSLKSDIELFFRTFKSVFFTR